MSQPPRRVIVGISGASGAVYGARLLQALQDMPNVESHLVVSDAGWRNLRHELDMDRASVEALADVVHDLANVGASIASGSFAAHGMVGQAVDLLGHAVPSAALEGLDDAGMEHPASLTQEVAVGDLLGEGMLKGIDPLGDQARLVE